LLHAHEAGVIIIAAGSNEGANARIAFPASLPYVFCIGATNHKGKTLSLSPQEKQVEKFSTFGKNVTGAVIQKYWKTPECREGKKSGTSIAAPIAAGIAALLLEVAHQCGLDAHGYEKMRRLFLSLSQEVDSYHYLTPWDLFGQETAPHLRIAELLANPAGLLVGRAWLIISWCNRNRECRTVILFSYFPSNLKA